VDLEQGKNKTCIICAKCLPLSAFYLKRNQCKPCYKENRLSYVSANKKKHAVKARKWYKDNINKAKDNLRKGNK